MFIPRCLEHHLWLDFQEYFIFQTLSSPRKFGISRSTPRKNSNLSISKHSTPSKRFNGSLNGSEVNDVKKKQSNEKDEFIQEEYVNDPNRLLEDEPPPKIMQRKDSLNDMSDEEDDGNPFWDFTNETRDDEVIYIEALQEEIKQLQVICLLFVYLLFETIYITLQCFTRDKRSHTTLLLFRIYIVSRFKLCTKSSARKYH